MKTNDEMRAHFLVDESHGSHMGREAYPGGPDGNVTPRTEPAGPPWVLGPGRPARTPPRRRLVPMDRFASRPALAAALPGVDPVTTGLEIVPLVALYELSIVLLRLSERRR